MGVTNVTVGVLVFWKGQGSDGAELGEKGLKGGGRSGVGNAAYEYAVVVWVKWGR